MRRTFDREGLGYVMRVPELAIDIAVDRLSRTRGELHGELSVSCGLPGTRSIDGHLHSARFNLSGSSTRATLAKTLVKRSNQPDIDWEDLLEDFCRRVLAAEREGDPVRMVGAQPIVVGETHRLAPILVQDQPAILYGEGGTGKSTLAAAIAVSVETGTVVVDDWVPRKAPILYLDWEAGEKSVNRRIRGVAMGARIPSVVQVRYLDCRRRGPLYAFAEDVARIVDQDGIGLVIVDSVGMASGTSSEGSDANESAIRLFAAFGFLGTTVLAIDHVSKAEAEAANRPARPYGSIYKTNLARATFELRRQRTADGASVIGIYNTKANDAATLEPMAMRIVHADDGGISYEPLGQIPAELTGPLTQADRIAAFLVGERLTPDELSELTGIPTNQVRAVLSRHKQRFNRLPSGGWELLPEVRGHAS